MTSYKDDKVFTKIIQLVLRSEGRYVVDSGGPTMFGISWNANAPALEALGLTYGTVMNLTLEQAKQIYFEKYWVASSASGLTDEGLAYIHFDCAVNAGVGEAKKCLNGLSVNPRFFDGTGDNNEKLFLRLVHEYESKRLDFYEHKVDSRLREKYLNGWMRRMEFVAEHAYNLV